MHRSVRSEAALALNRLAQSWDKAPAKLSCSTLALEGAPRVNFSGAPRLRQLASSCSQVNALSYLVLAPAGTHPALDLSRTRIYLSKAVFKVMCC